MSNYVVSKSIQTPDDEKWMRLALELAQAAFEQGEVPVGAVVVRNGELLASSHNECETTGLATKHAEIVALEAAVQRSGSRFLSDCTLYVTMEPCPMCAGACVNTHLGRICFGVSDPVSGACGSVINVGEYPLLFRPQINGGVLSAEARTLLQVFFQQLRKKGRLKNGNKFGDQQNKKR